MTARDLLFVLVVAAIGAGIPWFYAWTLRARPVKRPTPTTPPVSDGWTEHDAQTLRGYLASDTGRRLINRLKATEYTLAVSGARDVMHTGHSAGITIGYGQCLKHVQSLAHCGQKAEQPEAARTEEDELAELERRYSP